MTSAADGIGAGAAGPSGIVLPVTAFSRIADRIIGWAGEAASWLWTALMLLIVAQVVLRYVFSIGSIKMEEMQWHLFAVGFMLGLAFTEIAERHVRIDVAAEHWPQRRRLWVELIGITVFLLPMCGIILWFAIPFVATSWQLNEVSAAPDGLPFRWLLKSFVISSFALLGLAGLSRLSRVMAALGRNT
jgi:TRAP-type mannitol/chloroaromatic compound transport system permease small subunit